MFDIYIISLRDYILYLMMKLCYAWNFTGSSVSWTLLRSQGIELDSLASFWMQMTRYEEDNLFAN